MKIEEKIEIMFESILSELEGLAKKQGKTDPEKVQLTTTTLEQEMKPLIQAIHDIRIPVVKPDFAPLERNLKALIRKEKIQTKTPWKALVIIVILSIGLFIPILLNLYILWK